MAYVPSSIFSDLITICTYLLLRCLLSDRYCFLFNKEIMLIQLISSILIYTILFFSLTITFYALFGNTNLISGRFCLFGWLQPLGFLTHLLNPYCSFAIKRVLCVIIYLDDILVLTFSKGAGERAQAFLCCLLVCFGLHINFFKSHTANFYLGLC